MAENKEAEAEADVSAEDQGILLKLLMGDSTIGGLLPHFFCFQFFSYFHLFSTKNLSKVLRFFLLLTFSGKTGQKFAREVLKLAFQKCGRRPPLCYWSKSTKNKFSSWFLFVFSACCSRRWKIRFKSFFNQLEAKLTVKNRKLKSVVVDPPLCYALG